MGGILAGLPVNQTKALYDYGMQIGLAFQIVDDVLDYSDSHRTGKPVGTDLQERKITLPLSHLLDKASPRDHQQIKQILTATTITMDDVVHVTRLMERYQSLHYALESGRQFVAQAQKSLQSLPKIVFATPRTNRGLHCAARSVISPSQMWQLVAGSAGCKVRSNELPDVQPH